MSKTIESQFDEAMVKYVKDLKLKTVAFGGYDREDVYTQMRELLGKAREVCCDLTEKAVADAEENLLKSLREQPEVFAEPLGEEDFILGEEENDKYKPTQLSDDEEIESDTLSEVTGPHKFDKEDLTEEDTLELLNEKMIQLDIAESTIEALQREMQAVEEDIKIITEREEEARATLQRKENNYKEEKETLEKKAQEWQDKYEQLQKKQSDDESMKETMDQASAILREARLEGARLIDDSRAQIDQEILLGRAKRREEARRAKEEIKILSDEREKLAAACIQHRKFLSQSQALLADVLEFAKKGEEMSSSELERSQSGKANAVIEASQTKREDREDNKEQVNDSESKLDSPEEHSEELETQEEK